MLKITYEQEPYYYSSGKQAFTAKAEITMDTDASFDDILIAILRMAEYATYPKMTISRLKDIIDNLDYNFADEKEEIENVK